VTSCAEVARRLPAILDGAAAGDEVVTHVESCLACRSELARYKKMMRLLGQLREERPAVPDGLIEGVLTSLGVAAERQMIRSALSHRRLAYSGGLALSIAVASGVVVLARARLQVKSAGAEEAALR